MSNALAQAYYNKALQLIELRGSDDEVALNHMRCAHSRLNCSELSESAVADMAQRFDAVSSLVTALTTHSSARSVDDAVEAAQWTPIRGGEAAHLGIVVLDDGTKAERYALRSPGGSITLCSHQDFNKMH